LADGFSEAPVRLPPRSSTLVRFTVVSTVRNLVPQLFGVLSTGAVEYRLHGSITLETLGIMLCSSPVAPVMAPGVTRPAFKQYSQQSGRTQPERKDFPQAHRCAMTFLPTCSKLRA